MHVYILRRFLESRRLISCAFSPISPHNLSKSATIVRYITLL